jgi:hypothetical protein
MAEILQKAFQNAIDEQGEMEDKKSQKALLLVSSVTMVKLLSLRGAY